MPCGVSECIQGAGKAEDVGAGSVLLPAALLRPHLPNARLMARAGGVEAEAIMLGPAASMRKVTAVKAAGVLFLMLGINLHRTAKQAGGPLPLVWVATAEGPAEGAAGGATARRSRSSRASASSMTSEQVLK